MKRSFELVHIRVGMLVTGACMCLGLALGDAARAQGTPQSLPGLVVTVPPAASPPAAAPVAPTPPPAAPAAKPQRPTAEKKASGEKSAALAPSGDGKGARSGQSIIVLVNDDPITAYEVEQRAKLISLSTDVAARVQESFKRLVQQDSTNQRLREILQETIQANPGKSRDQVLAIFEERKKQFAESLQRQAMESARMSALPNLKKSALDELIEERLKIQEAKRINATIEDAQVDEVIRNIAQRNKMTPEQFAQHVKQMGGDIDSMKARFRATLSWNEVVRRRFSALVTVNQREIDKMVANSSDGEDQVELQIHRITLPMPGKFDQKQMARRLEEADRLRHQFAGCKSSAALAAKVQDAKFEDLGVRKPSFVPEPTRSLLLNAKEGEMVPPNMAASGIELYAVCTRKVLKADDQKRDRAAQELQQREFEVLAKRHLRDLRQDASIEYR
jgi:peptidyl-prolyl cis-trans isomerase SurA